MNAIVLKGVTIGDNSVVAAGAALVYVPAGVITAGAFAIAFGVSIAREG